MNVKAHLMGLERRLHPITRPGLWGDKDAEMRNKRLVVSTNNAPARWQILRIANPNGTTPSVRLIKGWQGCAQPQRLDGIQATVSPVATLGMVLCCPAVLSKAPERVSALSIVACDAARIAQRAQILGRIKAEGCRVAHRTRSPTVTLGSVSLSAILHDLDVLSSQTVERLTDSRHVIHPAEEMRDDDSSAPWRQGLTKLCQIDLKCCRMHVEIDRHRSDGEAGDGPIPSSIRAADHFVTRLDSDSPESEFQRVGTVGHADCILASTPVSEGALERGECRTTNELTGIEKGANLGQDPLALVGMPSADIVERDHQIASR